MKPFLVVSLFLAVCFFSQSAFANYGYHVNKRGTGYFRDDSNDGNEYNNANYLGLND